MYHMSILYIPLSIVIDLSIRTWDDLELELSRNMFANKSFKNAIVYFKLLIVLIRSYKNEQITNN